MKKVLFLNFNALRKVALMVIFALILFSFSSCTTLVDALLGDTACAHPGCNSNASGRTAYCHFHVPPTISENDPIKIDSKNAYKLHKPLESTDLKIKKKNY